MAIRKPNIFNVMIAGRGGLGKTSFVNTLLNNHIINITNPKDKIDIYSVNLPNKVSKKMNIITLPNLNYELNDEHLHASIKKYLMQQFNIFLEEETKIRRDPNFSDSRVSVLLYFIDGKLKESDIVFLKSICHLVNIILCLGKADSLTHEEINLLREDIKEQLFNFQIRIFKFEKDSVLEENEIYAKSKESFFKVGNKKNLKEDLFSLNEIMPFRVINRSWLRKDDERYSGDLHVDYENYDISDFLILREILLGDFTDELVDSTHYELYETYREDVLSKMIKKE